MSRLRKATLLLAAIIALYWYGPALWSLVRPSIIPPTAASQIDPSPKTSSATFPNNSFSYPSLEIEAPLTISQNTNPTVTSDWSKFRSALLHGVSLSYEGTSFQSAPLVFVVGHSSDSYPHPYSTIFAPLTEGKVGDTVDLDLNNTVYQYKIIDKVIISPTDASKFLSYQSTNPTIQRLEVVTCYPLFTSAKRLTLIAERSITPTTSITTSNK